MKAKQVCFYIEELYIFSYQLDAILQKYNEFVRQLYFELISTKLFIMTICRSPRIVTCISAVHKLEVHIIL